MVNNNDTSWGMWGVFLKDVDRALWPAVVEVAAAHEVGHCAERVSAEKNGSIASALGCLRSEGYADLFGATYAQRYMADQGKQAVAIVRDVRVNRSHLDATHATGEYLDRAGPIIQESRADTPLLDQVYDVFCTVVL